MAKTLGQYQHLSMYVSFLQFSDLAPMWGVSYYHVDGVIFLRNFILVRVFAYFRHFWQSVCIGARAS